MANGKGKPALVETPTAEFDQLALVNEVVAKRQEEAQDLRIQVSTLRHTLQQERIQWEEERRQAENALRMRALALEQAVAEKLGQADQLITARLEAFQQAENERRASVAERAGLQQDRRQLGDLGRERVEVERFRTEVTRTHAESQHAWTEAQAALNTASQRHDQATRLLAEVDRRTAELDALRATLDMRQEDLDLRAKHLNAVQEAIGQVIERLPVPEPPPMAPLPVSPEHPPVTPMALPPIQEAEPSGTLSEVPPELLPIPGVSGDLEVAPMATTVPPTPTDVAFPDVPGAAPYVHPSQRRVVDGTKPLNDQ